MLKIYLFRHGETEWTLSGQHTGVSDIDLTENGKNQAEKIADSIQGISFNKVLCSPMKRAKMTCELAHCMKNAEIDPDLKEWNYGQYEGLTTQEIWKSDPDWNIFLNGAPGGESVSDMGARAKRVIKKISLQPGNIALFSHGHFLRALTACWMELPAKEGRHLTLSPGSISILGYERTTPSLLLWNKTVN